MVHTGPNKQLDILSGEDIAPSKNFVRSKSDSEEALFPDEDDDDSDTEQNNSPVQAIKDLIGKTFLMDKQDDGQRYRARIAQIVEDFEGQVEKEPDRMKFKVSINNDEFEDLLSYQQVIDHITKDETSEVMWKYKRIVGHQGNL